jgi:branched-chain amino acid transport system permease protein
MESLPTAFGAGLLIGTINEAVLASTNRAALTNAVMFVVILAALLIQRSSLSRAMELGASTWDMIKEYRPIPSELRDVREVVIGKRVLVVAIGLLAITAPWIFGDVKTPQATLMVIYAMIGVSLVILTGWTGQISLGQYAIAGMASGIAGGLVANHGWDFFSAVITGGIIGAGVAALIGLPALRIQGLFLAVTTLAFAFAVSGYFLKREFFPWMLPKQGTFVERPILYGSIDMTTDSKLGWLTIPRDAKFYWLCLIFLAGAIALARSLRRNRSGRILIGTRDNGRLMQAFGVNLAGTRLAGFAISGFVAGVAGVLLAYQNEAFESGSFSPEGSLQIFVMTVIGGVGSIAGAMLGAVYVVGMPLLPGLRDVDQITLLTTSVGLLLLLLFLPGGLIEGVYRIRDSLLRRVAAKHGIHVPSLVADSLVTHEEAGMLLDQPVDDVPPAGLGFAPAGGGGR